MENAGQLFDVKRGPKAIDPQSDPERLYAKIGQLNMELDWLKKVRDQPLRQRQGWIDPCDGLPVVAQCQLAGIARSTVYANNVEVDEVELMLLRLLDEEYTRHPCKNGLQVVTVWLQAQGHTVNRKRVQRLMRILGLVAMAPGPNTSKRHPEHKVYPYLPRGLSVVRPNQVWSIDITYVRLAHGFVYLVAIIDWYSRKVLAWQVSNTMDVGFCVDCLTAALKQYGTPDIFNTDQGRSVKYEDIYPKNYVYIPELLLGLTEYFAFYNGERYHQALSYKMPDQIYQTAEGGGAMIVDQSVINGILQAEKRDSASQL